MNFRRLVAPVFIAVVLSIAAFVAVVVIAADLQDDAALETEKKVLTQELQSIQDSLRVLTEDNAWWDVAFRNIIVEENIDWIDRTLGNSVTNIGNIQGVLVIRPDGTLVYSNFVDGIPAPHQFMDRGFHIMAVNFPQPETNFPTSRTGLVLVDGELLAFSASTVQTAGMEEIPETFLTVRRPLIVFVSRLNDTRLQALGEANAIDDLTLGTVAQSDASLPVVQFDGAAIGHLNWRSSAPGSDMIGKTIIPAMVLLAVVILAMGRFVRRANQLVEALEDANRAKSAFLASTSHEIRTPLNSILGFTEMILLELYGKVEGAKNKEYLGLIKDSGEHLLSIINDILDISKLEAGRFEVFTEKVDPIHVVETSCRIVKPNAHDKDITVRMDCAPASLLSDERIMRQVLINLLSNAIKFTERGGSVTIRGKIESGVYRMAITDTGVGMSQDEVKTALALFGQVQNEMVRSHRGTGLGLPLVCRFMERLGGTFAIASTPGAGTTITLTFPLYNGPPHIGPQ